MTDTKPHGEAREWTLRLTTLIVNNLSEEQQRLIQSNTDSAYREIVHVIEHSAYDRLAQRVTELEAERDIALCTSKNWHNEWQASCSMYQKQIDALEEANRQLSEKLWMATERIQHMVDQGMDTSTDGGWDYLRDTLEKLK